MLEMTSFDFQTCLILKELKHLETEFHYFGLFFFPEIYHRRQNENLGSVTINLFNILTFKSIRLRK